MTLPPAVDLQAEIRKEHHATELMRIRSGLAGCGCDTCQELYRQLDLDKFGKRVISFNSISVIVEGLTGTDPALVEQYRRQDTIEQALLKPRDKPQGVTKPVAGESITTPDIQAQPAAEVLLQKNKGGRPRLPAGKGCRMTLWRQQRVEQGVLL